MYETRPCCKGGCVRIIEMRRGLSLIFSNKARSSPVLLVFPSYPCLDLKKQTNCSIPQISQRLTVQYNVVLPLQWLHIKMQRLVVPPNYAIFLIFFLPSFYCLSCWNMYCPWQKYYHLHLWRKRVFWNKSSVFWEHHGPFVFLTIQSDCFDRSREEESLNMSRANTAWLKAAPG